MAGRVSVYENTPGTAEVVLLGDSMIDWGNWHELLPGLSHVNRGLAGDTSRGVLARLPEVVQRKPRMVALMIGVNDILEGAAAEAVARNIQAIVQSFRDNQIHVVLHSVIFMSAEAGYGANPNISRLNTLLRKFAANEGIAFVDLNTTLAPGGVLLPDLTHDGLHLSGKGYVLWADVLRPFLTVQSP